MYQLTTALTKIVQTRTKPDKKRGLVVQGGTSAGKTIAILMYLIERAQLDGLQISVVAESLPHLKRGAMRDFLNIMKTHKYYRESHHNKTDFLYQFGDGYIEFFGGDDPTKLRGPRRDILFINEANNMPMSTFEQLEVRTRDEWIIDFNPVSEFWAHTDVIGKMECDFIILTYKDNEALEPSIIKSIESRKHNKNWWKVYGEGQIGVKEGQVYEGWKVIDAVPDDARLQRRWIDFGYTNDPTAIGDWHKWNDAVVLDEQLYRTGMTNQEIAKFMKTLPDYQEVLAIADSAEPKSIEELKLAGVLVQPAVKGPGSVNFGIQGVQDLEVYVTKRSVNILKEQRNYLWKLDRDGKPLNVPEDIFNHHMDGIRYVAGDLASTTPMTEDDIVMI